MIIQFQTTQIMKQKLTYLCGLAATLLLAAACTNDDPLPAPEQETGSATFHIDTRAGGDGRTTHLYVAQRPTENNDEALECIDHQTLTGSSFTLENMTARWYKLAFVSVPQGATVSTPDEDGKEYNDYIIDYSGVLNIENQGKDDDLAIYRQVIDRWLMPGQNLSETVTLTRLTGQLILNMGKLIDQFPGQVTNITVTLTDVPNQIYVHDNANGDIIPAGTTAKYTYSYDVEDPTSENDFVMYFNLLPFTLKGYLTKEDEEGTEVCRVAITYKEGEGEEEKTDTETYPLRGKDSEITIQRNTQTYVYFNGLESDEFVVRYDIPTDDDDGDGVYDDGGGIGVDDDIWDGWNDEPTTPTEPEQ